MITINLSSLGLILINNFEPIRAPINWPNIIDKPREKITLPKYKNTMTAPALVEKFRAFALAVDLINSNPLNDIPVEV